MNTTTRRCLITTASVVVLTSAVALLLPSRDLVAVDPPLPPQAFSPDAPPFQVELNKDPMFRYTPM